MKFQCIGPCKCIILYYKMVFYIQKSFVEGTVTFPDRQIIMVITLILYNNVDNMMFAFLKTYL